MALANPPDHIYNRSRELGSSPTLSLWKIHDFEVRDSKSQIQFYHSLIL